MCEENKPIYLQIIEDLISECNDETGVIDIISQLIKRTHDREYDIDVKINIGLIVHCYHHEYFLIVVPKNLIKNVFTYQTWDYLYQVFLNNGFQRIEENKWSIVRDCLGLGYEDECKVFKIGDYARRWYVPEYYLNKVKGIEPKKFNIHDIWLSHDEYYDPFREFYE
jgi:hypothetical protein